MHLNYRNINDAFRGLVEGIHTGVIPTSRQGSRNGGVLVVQEPVLITYRKPNERVLFNSARDWPCFFTLYEALWMLAGRNDVAPLAYYCSRMKEFSDDGETLNGAYGYRWRHAAHRTVEERVSGEDIDQLDVLVNHLKADPTSRRAVLSMWNVEDDLLMVGGIYDREYFDKDPYVSKDVCCNLNVMFSLRATETTSTYTPESGYRKPATVEDSGWVLDMTVTNRSNDLIWGLLGTNYVHFTVLQEYMAARLGVEVGVYHHFSNNLHAYEWNWKPEEWLTPTGETIHPSYSVGPMIPLVKDPAVFERELPRFVERHSKDCFGQDWEEPFLMGVAQPMCVAFHQYKRREFQNALDVTSRIEADDWRIAATNWIKRRMK